MFLKHDTTVPSIHFLSETLISIGKYGCCGSLNTTGPIISQKVALVRSMGFWSSCGLVGGAVSLRSGL